MHYIVAQSVKFYVTELVVDAGLNFVSIFVGVAQSKQMARCGSNQTFVHLLSMTLLCT